MALRRFEHRIAIVTGASQGIGHTIACELALEGATLVLNARNEGTIKALCKESALQHARIEWLVGDICEQATVDDIVELTLNSFGQIDILINNVGGGNDHLPIEAIDDETWHTNIDRNLTSAFRTCRRVLPIMQQNDYGRVVNISSVAGRSHGNLSGIPYSAAKAGLQGMTRHLAWDYGSSGITVNALAPGVTETPRAMDKLQRLSSSQQQSILDGIALKRYATTREIARAALFLASDDASYVTGATLDVNGGLWMS